jgi:alpha-tubulin suppressor-like RCC1 family protein
VSVSDISTATAIAVGDEHSCALLSDGTVKCWGLNFAGELGDGTNNYNSNNPVSVSGISNAKAIAAGGSHSCALLSNGTVKCWGRNEHGELGNGTTGDSTNSNTPVSVSGISNATAIAAGPADTCAVLSDGTAECWGFNASGQLGNGTTTDSATPVSVSGITNAAAISAGAYHSCALLSDGTVKCWGFNGAGELGNGTFTDSLSPVSVIGLSQ